jgi:ribosomal protein S18 acetylase RimI-like enzyme
MSASVKAPPVRRMTDADIPQVATVSAEAFEIDIATPPARRNWEARLRHSLRTDPEGSLVTESRGVVTGAAQAVIRDRLWILSLLTVSPSAGRGGEGRALVSAALEYDREADGAVVIASNDPRAMRLYGSSGFRLEPTFQATGRVDPSLIPDLHPGIVEVSPSELEALAPISRAVRGAAHTRDFGVALSRGASVFALEDRGFVVTTPGRGVWLLAARDEQAATDLLWRALVRFRNEPRIEIDFVSGSQQWALQVFLSARLSFKSYGGICTRGDVGPLRPYIPSPPFA